MHANILPGTEHIRALRASCAMVSLALSLLATPAGADTLQIFGYSGLLGEWELTATVRGDASSPPKKYSGPISMKHVGICTQDGPEEKAGEIRVQMMASESYIEATLWVDDVECSYHGILSDFYTGTLDCPGREPVPLKLWIKESK